VKQKQTRCAPDVQYTPGCHFGKPDLQPAQRERPFRTECDRARFSRVQVCIMTRSGALSPRRGGTLTLPPLVKGVVRGELELTIGGLAWESPAAKAVSCQARAAACLLSETAARSNAA